MKKIILAATLIVLLMSATCYAQTRRVVDNKAEKVEETVEAIGEVDALILRIEDLRSNKASVVQKCESWYAEWDAWIADNTADLQWRSDEEVGLKPDMSGYNWVDLGVVVAKDRNWTDIDIINIQQVEIER